MFLGTVTLNWLSGIGFGKRLDRNSPNFVARIYRVWAATDPNARADRVDGPVDLPAPWVTALCATNALATCLIEILLLSGMLQDPLPPYVVPAAFAFCYARRSRSSTDRSSSGDRRGCVVARS
jgi:hypothetical protein